MGIDYQAAVMVGLPRKDFEDSEQLGEWIDNEDLEVCAPYYNGNADDSAIVGFDFKLSRTYQPSEMEWDQAKIDQLKADFKALTGMDAKVWLSPRGW